MRNITDGIDSRKSVNDTDFPLSLREIREEISAFTSKLSLPETCAEIYALLFGDCHDMTL